MIALTQKGGQAHQEKTCRIMMTFMSQESQISFVHTTHSSSYTGPSSLHSHRMNPSINAHTLSYIFTHFVRDSIEGKFLVEPFECQKWAQILLAHSIWNKYWTVGGMQNSANKLIYFMIYSILSEDKKTHTVFLGHPIISRKDVWW